MRSDKSENGSEKACTSGKIALIKHGKENQQPMQSFRYNGMSITPKRKLNRSERQRGLLLPLSSIGVSNYQYLPARKDDIPYDYDEFYKEATKVGAGKIDVFEYQGMDVVPCKNELFQLKYD